MEKSASKAFSVVRRMPGSIGGPSRMWSTGGGLDPAGANGCGGARQKPQTGDVNISLLDYARAVPLNAIEVLLPRRSSRSRSAATLLSLRDSDRGLWNAIDSAGRTGRSIMTVLAALGGDATPQQFAFQTAAADVDDLAEATDRLCAAGLVERRADGSLSLAGRLAARSPIPSMADPNMINSDVLAVICRRVGVATPIPTRKSDRIDAIAAVFADTTEAARVRGSLPGLAQQLLDEIARVGGVSMIDPERIGVESYLLRYAAPSPYQQRFPEYLRDNHRLLALRDLAAVGIVGLGEWGGDVWIWREAWPLLDRAFITDWPAVRPPEVVAVADSAVRMPSIVAAVDQALQAWEANPPAVLKNGDARVAKTHVRATAKSIGATETTVDLVGRLVIALGLLLPNVVATSGRGRNRRVEQSWMADPTLLAAWQQTAPIDRWLRLFAEWCSPSTDVGEQLLANRQLVLWELAGLDDATGVRDERAFATWMAHRYGTIGVEGAVAECIAELRSIGAVTVDGPVALTRLGRAALTDPATVGDVVGEQASSAIVQADLTVTAPPDLRHDLTVRLALIAEIESDSAAVVYRLSPERITRAVQAGDTAEDIIGFLTELSSVPVTDTVERLVIDAAARAGRVRVIAATTVVIVSDAADLATACSVKSAKLTAVSDTVAVSDVAAGKVTAALEKKGLAPHAVVDTAARPRRSSEAEAAMALERAAALRASTGAAGSYLQRHADELERQARATTDVNTRLRVSGPLAVTPHMAAQRFADQRSKTTT